MSWFGDDAPEDSYVHGNVLDPEQVARRIHELRLTNGRETVVWDALDPDERAVLVAIVVALIAWLVREGSG